MHSDSLIEIARNLGIASQFVDNSGDVHEASSEALTALVKAITPGEMVSVDFDSADAATSKINLGSRVLRVGEPVEISCADLQSDSFQSSAIEAHKQSLTYQWVLRSEYGDVHTGQCTARPESNVVTSNHRDYGAANKNAVASSPCLAFDLPADLDCGYHQLTLTDDTVNKKPSFEIHLIVVPVSAWSGVLEQRACGVSLQLYALRSERNWGIGDFTDLESVCSLAADADIDVIGLNPLHALYSAHPSRYSPYSPTSREFLNPLYIDVDRITGAADCKPLRQLYQEKQFQQSLYDVQNSSTVCYEDISALKLAALWLIYNDYFAADEEGDSKEIHNRKEIRISTDAFSNFEKTASEALRLHARFQAFDNYFSERSCENWQQWPIEFQDAKSTASESLAVELAVKIRFHIFLQWVAAEQLAAVSQHCKDLGMRYGLYMDLAVGVDRHAGDVWAFPDLHALGVHIGAPPDALGPLGQDWSLTPYNPGCLQRAGFKPFVEMLRANMRHCGMLRIDHVMGLMRQYWCVPDLTSKADAKTASDRAQINGSYIEFPFNELLGILALESHRNQCLIVGEDLGTVPAGFRQSLSDHNILGYRVLYFERKPDDSFIAPADYRLHSLATASTHDLPPLAGFFQGLDMVLRDTLGHYEDVQAKQQAFDQREDTIQHLRNAFVSAGIVDAVSGSQTLESCIDDKALAMHNFVDNVHRLLSSAASHIVMFQLEDLLMQTQMMNLPGTVDEHPNWQRRMPSNIEEFKTHLCALSGLRAACTQDYNQNAKND